MATWPLPRIGEILIDGVWVPVPMRETTKITIARGINSEAVKARPGSMGVRVNDFEGEYSPRNPESDLFGEFGRNTEFRFRVGDVPATPAAVLTDTFTRTVANGWGASTSGTTWAIYDPNAVSPPASDYSVSSGAGRMNLSTVGASRYIATDGLDLADYEATFTIATANLPKSSNSEAGLTLSAVLRANTAAAQYYTADINLLSNTGLPNNAGLRVSFSMLRVDAAGVFESLSPRRQVPSLVYAAGTPLRVRVRCEGPELKARVWAASAVEPDHWHIQGYDTVYTTGEFGFRGIVRGTDTTLPVSVSFDDLEVRPLAAAADTVRMRGDIAGLTPYQDESGNDAYVDLDVAGVLRRYDGPQKPVKSALRRHISGYGASAYWAFEEGAQGDTAVAEFSEQSTTGPLFASSGSLEFARDDTLVGSSALPLINGRGRMVSRTIAGVNTGYWGVYLMVKFTTDKFPTTAGRHELLAWRTDNAFFRLSAELSGGEHFLVLDGTDDSGASFGSVAAISHEDLQAAGRLGFLDRWQQVKAYAIQSGATTTFTLALLDPDNNGLTSSISSVAIDADRVRAIGTLLAPGVQGAALGHLSVWGVAFTDAYTSDFNAQQIAYEAGATGMRVRDWLTVLSTDQQVALDVYGPGDTVLGPYAESSFIALAEDAAKTDMGLLVEHRDKIGLKYVTRRALYNAPVELVLDYTSGQIFAPFKPTDDDKGLINRITAKRRGGSEVTAEISQGPLSVQPPPNGINVKESTADTIVHADSQLADQAAWRLRLAAWDEMRIASLTLKMANPRMHAHLDAVLALREGSRIQVINTPKRYGPDGFDLIIRGSKEVHAEGVFDITLNCMPARPYDVAVVGPAGTATAPEQFRWTDTSGSQLAAALTTTDTAVRVLTTAGPRWTPNVRDTPVDWRVAGEVMTVTAPGALLNSNPFFTTDTAGWSQSGATIARSQAVVCPHPRAVASLRITPDGVSASGGANCARTPAGSITPGATYTVSMWVYSPGGWSDLRPAVDWYTSADVYITSGLPSASVVAAGVWTYLEAAVVAPATASRAAMRVRHGTTPSAADVYYVWAARITQPTSSWLHDTFTRSSASGWGTSDSGLTWNTVGGGNPTDYTVSGTYGAQVLATLDVSRRTAVTAVHADFDLYCDVTTSALATGDSLFGGPTARMADASNMYQARVEFTTANAIVLSIRKILAGVNTAVGASFTLPVAHTAGTFVRVRFQGRGSTLRAKAWLASMLEPSVWRIEGTDASLTVAAQIGTRSIRSTGNTNTAAVEIRYDNFDVVDPQTYTVTRSANRVSKSQAAGESVSLAHPAYVPL